MSDHMTTDATSAGLTELTAEIVSAFVAHNSVPTADLPTLLHSVHTALGQLGKASATLAETSPEPLKPAVPIKKSITEDYLISLENGQKFKSLKRHLMTAYNMTPDQYRAKWGLSKDYPMVAPGYAQSRSALAKSLGLGRKPNPAPMVSSEPARKAGRPRKAAAPAE